MNEQLKNKIDESTKMLENQIQKIINDFETKTKTKVLIEFKINEPIKIGLIVDLDTSTL